MPKPPSWVWQGDLDVQAVFLADCLVVLEGGEKCITRAHVAACADWALRATDQAERAAKALSLLELAFAQAKELAHNDEFHPYALGAKGPT